MQDLIECPKPHPCYTLVSVNLGLSKAIKLSQNNYKAMCHILHFKALFWLICAFVSESFQFINTTAVVRVVLEFNKTPVNQSISCRTDDPNASTTLFFNFQEQPVGGRISLDNQVYTIYGVKKTDAGYYQCKATSSQAGVGPISETVVFIVDEGKWLSCILVPINYWSVYVEEGEIIVYSKRLFMILEWLILSSYISLYLFTWYQNNILFLYKSMWNEFILVFFPNEIVVHVWNFILASCKLKANFVVDLELQIVYSVVSGACISELVRKLHKQEHRRLSRSILLCECRLNFTQEQNSSWN